MVAKSLTGVVRPFQTSNVQPPAVQQQAAASSTAVTPPKSTVIEYGRGSSPKTFSGTYDLTISYYKVRKPKEKQQQQ